MKLRKLIRACFGLALAATVTAGISCCLTACSKSSEVKGMEYWKLNDGGTGSEVANSAPGGTTGTLRYGVWLPEDTFGTVLDFSISGSYVKAENSKADLSGDFSISCWVMAPPREQNDRVIFSQGKDEVLLYLDAKNNFELTFAAEGLEGLASSGRSLTDSKWHHVLVTKEGQTLTYWIDGANVKSLTVSGQIAVQNTTITLGANEAGKDGFDGSMAEMKFIKGAKTPDQATSVTLKPSSNEAKAPRLEMKKGIVIDRPQYYRNLMPYSLTEKSDIINCINFGFDHVKIQLVPEWLMGADGSMKPENMEYVNSVVQMVLEQDYRVLVCISPCASSFGAEFKTKYLGTLKDFEILCKWYGEFAQYVKAQGWPADHVAIQLMTEPYGNTDSVSWTWMSDRMYAAVRNVLPMHTLVTSADGTGNMENLKSMSPATDSNLIYSFTDYQPVTPGWSNAYSAQIGKLDDFWNYLGDVPYPIEEGVDYSAQIEECIKLVPSQMKSNARRVLTAYVEGAMDGDIGRINMYGSVYNGEWMLRRAQCLDDWRQKYGGNIHLMVVEFGVFDGEFVHTRFGAAGMGVSEQTRLRMIRDMRLAWEAYDIGWSYWDYNEGFTVFDPTYHSVYPYSSPSEDCALAVADWQLITDALGLTPVKTYPVPAALKDALGAWSLTGDTFLSSALPGIGTDAVSVGATGLSEGTQFIGGAYAAVQAPRIDLGNHFTISAKIKTSAKNGTILTGGEESLVQTDGVYGKVMIHDFDRYWGVSTVTENNAAFHTDAPAQGSGCYEFSSTAGESINASFRMPLMDLSACLSSGNKASMHISLYIDDVTSFKSGTLNLLTPTGTIKVSIKAATLQTGWNDLIIPAEEIRIGGSDITNITDANIVFQMNKAGTVRLDDWYLFYPQAYTSAEYWKLFIDANGNLAFSAGGVSLPDSGVNVADGQWHHVIVTGADGLLVYYVDGQPVKSVTAPVALKSTASSDLIIGANAAGKDNFDGLISHVALYPTAKSPSAVWSD